MKYLFICYKRCTTCGRAKKWLDAHGIEYEWRDIDKQNPARDELKLWSDMSGLSTKKLFNTSGLKYRELGLAQKLKEMNEEEMYDLMALDGMLVKRPILVGNGKALFGFSEDNWSRALGKTSK